MSNATQWYDPDLKLAVNESAKKITFEESQRLAKLLMVAKAAGGIPRRVGQDATREELALDKKRARRIAHVAEKLLDSWADKQARQKITIEITREAAIVDWPRWWDDHKVWLENRLKYVATWSIKSGKDESWAKSAIVKLSNELAWLEYAMRD